MNEINDTFVPVSAPDVKDAENPQNPPMELSKEVIAKAEELIRLGLDNKNRQIKEEQLKFSLLPYVKINPIKTPSGQVFYVIGSSSKYINRDKLKQIMIEQLRISDQTADKILDMGSLDKIIQPYVKVITG